MKKIFQTVKFKKFNKKRARRSNRRRLLFKKRLKEKNRQEQERNRAGNLNIYNKTYRSKRTHEIVIPLPENFSIVDNAEEVLSVFSSFRRHAEKRSHIFFEMSGIKKISGDAIIYMLSMFDQQKKRFGHLNIRGNFPEDTRCSNLLKRSGFFRYLNTPAVNIEHSENVLEVERGQNVQPELAQKVINFARKHLKITDSDQIKRTYQTLIECMANTLNHAFGEKDINPFWYLMAIYIESDETIAFTFVDAGYGIPRTIRMWKESLKEKMASFLKKIHKNLKIISDTELIVSALEGKLKNRMGLTFRGRGLPEIYKYFSDKFITDLVIISRRGYVNSGGKNMMLKGDFSGTMISWKIQKNYMEAKNGKRDY